MNDIDAMRILYQTLCLSAKSGRGSLRCLRSFSRILVSVDGQPVEKMELREDVRVLLCGEEGSIAILKMLKHVAGTAFSVSQCTKRSSAKVLSLYALLAADILD